MIDRFSFLPIKGLLPEHDDDKEELERSFWLLLFLFLSHESKEEFVIVAGFAFLRLHLRWRLVLANFDATRAVAPVAP
jgi:hypothetical protein